MKMLKAIFLLFFTVAFLLADDEYRDASKLSTIWGANVVPGKVLMEYPRPQLQRENWENLNGLWDYAITPKSEVRPVSWTGKILVPFPPEAPLSGVDRSVNTTETLWYRKMISIVPSDNFRTFLNFEAVDYEAFIFLNGKEVGSHKGGFTPFSFDITSLLRSGDNEIVIRIVDNIEGSQLHGKQSFRPRGIWYPNVTGIWQTVWLEKVPRRFIESLNYTPDVKSGALEVAIKLSGVEIPNERIHLKASCKGVLQAENDGIGKIYLKLNNPKLWSPQEPNIYDLNIDLLDAEGHVVDSVKSYSALREVGKISDASGNPRICINGNPIFLFGPLDQGWWPDGYLTPPSDEAIISDLEFIKKSGFNMIRKHVKVESARYYYHCDRLGIAVWQDQVSSNYNATAKSGGGAWIRLRENPTDGAWPKEAHDQWVSEYQRMVDSLRNNPSVIIWSLFNEAWGQHQTMEVGKMALNYDRTRLVCVASGGNFWPVGDIASQHSYPYPAFPMSDLRFEKYVKAVGEMGGHGWAMPGHTLVPKGQWGYGGICGTIEDFKSRYIASVQSLKDAKNKGLSAAVYTQATDVFTEMNGLLTFDRVPKVDSAWLRKVNSEVMDP